MKTEKSNLNLWDRIMMAVTFAEAGEADTARDILKKRNENQQRPESKARKESTRRPELRV